METEDFDLDGGYDLPNDQDEFALYSAAFYGICNGDLRPLAAYLRSGYSIHPNIRREIANAIDGVGKYLPLKLSHINGWRSLTSIERKYQKDMRIGAFIDAELEVRGRGSFDSAIALAAQRFGVSEGKARASLRSFRKAWSAGGGMVANLAVNDERRRRDPAWYERRIEEAKLFQLRSAKNGGGIFDP